MSINEKASGFALLNSVADDLTGVDRFSPDAEKLVQCEISNSIRFYMNGARTVPCQKRRKSIHTISIKGSVFPEVLVDTYVGGESFGCAAYQY